ncbi:MAG: hypothetical protein AAF219_10900, partial [Myxococcota bacterium]
VPSPGSWHGACCVVGMISLKTHASNLVPIASPSPPARPADKPIDGSRATPVATHLDPAAARKTQGVPVGPGPTPAAPRSSHGVRLASSPADDPTGPAALKRKIQRTIGEILRYMHSINDTKGLISDSERANKALGYVIKKKSSLFGPDRLVTNEKSPSPSTRSWQRVQN